MFTLSPLPFAVPLAARTLTIATVLAWVSGCADGNQDGETSGGETETGGRETETGGGGVGCGWIEQFGGEPIDEATALVMGPTGNVFVSGFSSVSNEDQTGVGDWDGFVGMWSADGELQWMRVLGSTEPDRAHAVAADADGNVYVAGNTVGQFDGVAPGDIFGDGFLVKLDADGNELWRRQIATADGIEASHAVTTDSQGGVYVAGSSNGLLGSLPLIGSYDAYVIKYNASGTEQWVYQLGTAGSDSAVALATDGADSIFVAGNTDGVLVGQTALGDNDAFVAKLGSDGVERWTRQFGTPFLDGATGLATDAQGAVYTAGATDGAFEGQTNAGLGDVFVARFDADGTQTWLQQFGSAEYDTCSGVSSDAQGVYVTGYTDGELDAQALLGGRDMFVAKFDPMGIKQWTRVLGTDGIDRAAAVAAGGDGTFLVAGTAGGGFESGGGDGGGAVVMRVCEDS